MLTLTPQARAIAAITLAFLLISGALNQLGVGLVAVLSNDLTTRTASTLISLVMLAVGAGVLALAHFAATTAPEGWAQATGQAAQLLALVGLAITALALISSIVHGNPVHFFAYNLG